jgi:hypothetical protein
MAALTTEPSTFASLGGAPLIKMPKRGIASTTYFRGALTACVAAGQAGITTAADGAQPAGIALERTVTVSLNDPVNHYIFGFFLFANANATIANHGAQFTKATASDNPADMTTATGANRSATFAQLIEAKTSGTDGWFHINAGDRLS